MTPAWEGLGIGRESIANQLYKSEDLAPLRRLRSPATSRHPRIPLSGIRVRFLTFALDVRIRRISDRVKVSHTADEYHVTSETDYLSFFAVLCVLKL